MYKLTTEPTQENYCGIADFPDFNFKVKPSDFDCFRSSRPRRLNCALQNILIWLF